MHRHRRLPIELLAFSLALGFATPTALAQGCGADGQILTRADLLARLGGSAVLEGFETFSIAAGSATSLDVYCLDDTTVANGQGPGLVQPGATYCDPSAVRLQWNADQYYSRTTNTLLSNGNTGSIFITYTQSVKAMGVDLSGFIGYPYSGTATVYDTANALVGTVNFAINSGGPERFFVGWAHGAGIGRIEIVSAAYPWSPKIDDHAYGDCGVGCSVADICDPTLPDFTDGCTPDVSWTGTPDATQCNVSGASDFVLTFGSMSENKSCNVVIGKGAPFPLAWSSASTRCFPVTYSRTALADTGDVNGGAGCGGQVVFDVENYLQGGNPLLTPVAAGEAFVVQTWYRDPASTKSTQMSDAASFTVCP